jgi:hypothetical protein
MTMQKADSFERRAEGEVLAQLNRSFAVVDGIAAEASQRSDTTSLRDAREALLIREQIKSERKRLRRQLRR